MGDALGLYKTLDAKGPMSSAELAKTAKVDERYLREWLSHQAASNYLAYDPVSSSFSLPIEQAMVFARDDSPVYLMGGFDVMAASLDTQPKVQAASNPAAGSPGAIKRAACSVRSPAFSGPASPNKLVSSVASGARWRDGQAAGRCARR
jgi:hypothetical protein